MIERQVQMRRKLTNAKRIVHAFNVIISDFLALRMSSVCSLLGF
jgi:hypothetical protein